MNKNCILIVDDDFINRELLKNIFSSQFEFEEAENGKEGYEKIHSCKDKICAILLDVEMPEMTGIEILEKISEQGITEEIPVFLITAHNDDALVEVAYRYGVMDVISKPVSAVVVERRVKSVIELFSARERLHETVKGQELKLSENARKMDSLHRGTLEALATAIEFRDIESGQHVSRIYGMTKYILSHTSFGDGLSAEEIENIATGSIMHDVGKIAISDVILNKPGRLTNEEFDIMKKHTVKGADLLVQISDIQSHESYTYAADIARHHHERWDGRGYPDGLIGDEISIASQVVSIVDVYDALVSVRVYKAAYTPDEAVNMIKNGECGIFNPKLLECFLEAEPAIRKWYTLDDEDNTLKKITEDTKRIGAVYNEAAKPDAASFDSVTDMMLLMTAVQNVYDAISAVNLTKNTFHILGQESIGIHSSEKVGVYDDVINMACEHIVPAHKREFREKFSRENLLKAFDEGVKSVRMEYQQITDSGDVRWMSCRVLLLQDGRTKDIIQITMIKYIDDEYQNRAKTRKILTDALNLAERANNAKYDFLSKMSHDIRTPLNAIIGMTTIIAANLENPEKISDCLLKIGTSSKYLLGIINDVLDYSKIENGSLVLNKADFNIRDLITEISNEIIFKAKQKHQQYSVTVADDINNSYVGDEHRIYQIISNLLDNAYNYTPEGGKISLKVRCATHSGGYDVLNFEVADNGKGIEKEFIDRLFEPFAQADPSEIVESIGLGLPISQNLAHLMNGEIGVISEAGNGSTFTLEIPLEIGNMTAYSETIDTDINVLIVDDEIAVCEYAQVLLGNMGITAQITDNGADAVKKVAENKNTENAFDVAIVDWKMPGMDGVETVKQIRKIVGRNVLVAIMSAYDWSDIEEEARAAGVDLFIAKPILETNLRTTIACSERILREHQNITFNGEKVLVAEDNDFNAEVAKSILEMKNLKVELAKNGREAYEKFINSEIGEYTAIFMDILMPVMDGHEGARAIRESKHAEAKTMPIYAMTANAFHNDILEAKLAGMNGHIAKPVDFDEVARILNGIVKNKQMVNFPMGGGV